MDNATVEEGKTTAIIAYITVIGFIIAIVMNSTKKNEFAAFHIRQMLGLVLLGLSISILSAIADIYILSLLLQIGLIVLWVIGLVSAIQGETKPVPLLGEQFQEWFASVR